MNSGTPYADLVLNDRNSNRMVLSQLHQELETCIEFKFCVAFATREAVMMLFQQLLELGKRGVGGKVILSQYLNFTEPGA